MVSSLCAVQCVYVILSKFQPSVFVIIVLIRVGTVVFFYLGISFFRLFCNW